MQSLKDEEMNTEATLEFTQQNILELLPDINESALDNFQFGIIGFDAQTIVQRYNEFESKLAGLQKSRVIGHPLFTSVAPCMNNFMVAQRFEDAWKAGDSLDTTIDYVLTLRMRPVKVKLRLLTAPNQPLSYVLLLRPQIS